MFRTLDNNTAFFEANSYKEATEVMKKFGLGFSNVKIVNLSGDISGHSEENSSFHVEVDADEARDMGLLDEPVYQEESFKASFGTLSRLKGLMNSNEPKSQEDKGIQR